MYLEEPDLQLRNAIISYFWAKGDYVSGFLVDYKIESVTIGFVKHNEKRYKYMVIKPKVLKKKTKNTLVIGGGFYKKSYEIRDIKVIVNNHKKIERELINIYKEPYPYAWDNMNPYSRKKQKPKKRR